MVDFYHISFLNVSLKLKKFRRFGQIFVKITLPDYNHGRVSKSSDINGGLEVRLSNGLGPEPTPALLLVFVSQLPEVFQEGITATSLNIFQNKTF